MKNFASDNNSGVHPKIMKRLTEANFEHSVGYGNDIYTENAVRKFKELFGKNAEIFFVYNGTGANVTALNSVLQSFQSVITTETSHINVDECGSLENLSGSKIISVQTKDGKLTIEEIKSVMHGLGDEHHSQPRVISITQTTELGTVYSVEELKKITNYAHDNNLIVHMDGARISNAAVYLNKNLKEITADVGVDILSFGGTKNGAMFGETVIFFNDDLAQNYKYYRKQGAQLHSKMRFISVQFEELLANNLWKKNAENANRTAKILFEKLSKFNCIKITQKVQSNGIFAILPKVVIDDVLKRYFFYYWNEDKCEVRFMTSFDTTEKDVDNFYQAIKKSISNNNLN
jgi:threonine aldolase